MPIGAPFDISACRRFFLEPRHPRQRQYEALRAGEIAAEPEELVRHAVGEVLRLYARAGGELP